MVRFDEDGDEIPEGLRAFDDARATRKLIYDGMLDSVRKRFPVENDEYRIELSNVRYTGPQEYSLKQVKDALLKNRKLQTPMSGTWRLVHKPTNAVLDERDDVIMHVPYYTDRGTLISNGNEYTVVNQARLRAGVYARRKKSGEVEAQFNTKPGTGPGFHVEMSPSTGVFTLTSGQAHIPLYSVLRGLGVDDKAITKAWGSDIAVANAKKHDPRAMRRLYARLAGRKAVPNLSDFDTEAFVKDALAKTELDEEVVQRTMGLEGVKSVTPELLLRASQKVLNISRGDEQEDKRDAPRFAQVYSIEDFLKERVDKDSGKLSQQLLWRAKRDRSLGRIHRGALDPYVDQFLNGTGLALPGDEASPLSNYVQMHRLTRLGQGGIGSIDLVTDEARDVQGDYLGYVDPVAGPESPAAGVDVRIAGNTYKGTDGQLYTKMLNMRTGKREYVSLAKASDHRVAFPGQDPKSPYLYAMKDNVPTRVPRDEVDYMVPSIASMETTTANLNPMPTGVQGARQFYATKFWEQYLPMVKGEVPLVDSLMPNGKETFSEHYGKRVASVTSQEDGIVTAVDGDHITVKGADGRKHDYELVKYFPHNRMSSFSTFPSVEVGQEVKKGDLLAHSNYTDAKTGAFNMGVNLKVAIMPSGDSGNYEDAITISETAAKKLATEQLFGFDADTRNGVEIDKKKYMSLFPQKFTKDQYATLDDNGVVKPGTELHRGDPIIVSVGPKLLSAKDAQLGRLSKVLRNAYTDKAEVWEHDWPGTVVDAVATSRGAKVNVVTTPPKQIGDKLSPSQALKGVIGCYDSRTEVFTDRGWIRWPDVTMETRLACFVDGHPVFMSPDRLYRYRYSGFLIHAHHEQLDYMVTPNHRMWCRIENYRGKKAKYRIRYAEDVYGKSVVHKCASRFDLPNEHGSVFDLMDHTDYDPSRERKKSKTRFLTNDVAEFLGWYISEGNLALYRGSSVGQKKSEVTSYKIQISQSSRVHDYECSRIESLLDRMGVRWSKHNSQYTFSSKAWYKFLKPLGKCSDKRIPECCWSFGTTALDLLFDALMLGDGTEYRCKTTRSAFAYYTDSAGLAEDVSRLATLVGYSAVIRSEVHENGKPRYVVRMRARSELSQASAEFSREEYTGFVYCASVPGGLLLVKRDGYPMWCGNSVRPDSEMPRDAYTNEPYEILMNPMGFLSRVAPNQLIEIALGKLAKKTGQQVRIPQLPPEEGWAVWAQRQLDAAGVKDSSDVFDPRTGKTLRGIGDGYVHIHAFHHLAEKKLSARGDDASYTQDEAPSRGGFSGAKRVSGLSRTALLSHGATENLKDMMTIRGTKNEEYWNKLRLGLPVQEPGVPFIYTKFLESLKAGGINVVEKGDKTSILPLTDKDIDAMSEGRTITSSKMVDSDLRPVAGGLFDVGKTGGPDGNRWTAIKLPEPVPNPVMEEPVRRVLGLTVEKLEGILAGTEKLDGKTGGEAIKSALEKVDVDARIRQARSDIQNKRGAARDDAVKVLGYLKSMQEQGLEPKDWMITKVPVIPPKFRPVSKLGDVQLVSDMNDLYKDVIENAENYMALKGSVADSSLADERLNLYKSVAAAFGLGDPITPEGQAKNIKGAIRQVIGTGSPKWSMFQAKIIAKNLDNVGRGVVIPDENYDMDQLGVPEKIAWEVYKPYVQRSLVRRGYNPVQATRMIEERDKTAEQFLRDEMDRRPILMERAPAWHKFNVMAFRPKIVDGNVLRVSPLVDEPYNMDHDGDQVNIHVPSSDKAVREAYERMLPSKNLIALDDLSSPRYKLSKEQVLGLYNATQPALRKPVTVFRTVQDAKEAYRKGLIGLNDPIRILQR